MQKLSRSKVILTLLVAIVIYPLVKFYLDPNIPVFDSVCTGDHPLLGCIMETAFISENLIIQILVSITGAVLILLLASAINSLILNLNKGKVN